MKYMFTISLLAFIGLAATWQVSSIDFSPEDNVQDILVQLGGEALPHTVKSNIEGVSVEKGMELLTTGITTKANGGKTKKQSSHFLCTSCHNMLKEDPDLAVADPQARLDYAISNGLPFLQGTTFYGIINRTSFYNGDYVKKYGDLVEDARHDLRNAIQLCATTCAQGRLLEEWEVESILAYFEQTGLKMKDLILSEVEANQINQAISSGENQDMARNLIQSKYLQASPAHFIAPPENRSKGPEDISQVDIENGAAIYQHSCLHCHENQRFSLFELGPDKLSLKFLDKHFNKYNRYSTYQVVRWGTSPIPGKKSYMPNYTQERMSVQQLEDLKAYMASSN